MACRELGADTALLTEIRDGREHIRWGVGEGRLRRSRLPAARHDLRAAAGRPDRLDRRRHAPPSRRWPASPSARSRAYIGVPFTPRTPAPTCSAAWPTRPGRTSATADVRFLQGVAESLRPVLGVRRLGVAAARLRRRLRRDHAPWARAPSPRRARPCACRRSGTSTRRCLRHRAAGGQGAPVRRRAGREDPACSRAARSSRRSWTSRNVVTAGGEQGLLSMAFAPDYASSGLFYVYYTDKRRQRAGRRVQALERRRGRSGQRARRCSSTPDPEANHNGGQLQFGPDKLLYIGTGDGGGGGDQHGAHGNGQNLGVLLGKILRIDPKASGGRPYTIPADNPFVKRAGARGRDLRLRPAQPVALLVRPSTGDLIDRRRRPGRVRGDRLHAQGQGARARTSAGACSRAPPATTPGEKAPGAVKPVITESHADGNCSITGGVVIRDPDAAGLERAATCSATTAAA